MQVGFSKFVQDTGLQFMEGTHVLIVPVYSARSRVDGLYRMQYDSNFQMAVYLAYNYKLKHLSIALPPESCIADMDYVNNMLRLTKLNVTKQHTDGYGKNAYETRCSTDWRELASLTFQADYVLASPQSYVKFLKDNVSQSAYAKTYYWAYAIATNSYMPDFFRDFIDLDREFYDDGKMVVATPGQLKTYPNAIADNNIWSNELFTRYLYAHVNRCRHRVFGYSILFNPFKQSHKPYRSNEIDMIYGIAMASSDKPLVHMFSAPNDSYNMTAHPSFRVNADKNSYYRLLEQQPIILSYADYDESLHLSAYEFAYFKVPFIYRMNSMFKTRAEDVSLFEYYGDKSYADLVTMINRLANG